LCPSLLFFSPSKVQRARELQDAKEAAKEREALDKVSRAEARACSKAQREQAKEARNAQKQLETESKASQKRPRGRPPKQKEPQGPSATVIEPIKKTVSVQPRSRNGRIIRKPAHFDEM
jgi:hypothetical protein